MIAPVGLPSVANPTAFGRRKWLPWFRQIFEEGQDDSVKKVTRLILTLASGPVNALSGCTLSIDDDLIELVRQAKMIKQAGLYTLKLAAIRPEAANETVEVRSRFGSENIRAGFLEQTVNVP